MTGNFFGANRYEQITGSTGDFYDAVLRIFLKLPAGWRRVSVITFSLYSYSAVSFSILIEKPALLLIIFEEISYFSQKSDVFGRLFRYRCSLFFLFIGILLLCQGIKSLHY